MLFIPVLDEQFAGPIGYGERHLAEQGGVRMSKRRATDSEDAVEI